MLAAARLLRRGRRGADPEAGAALAASTARPAARSPACAPRRRRARRRRRQRRRHLGREVGGAGRRRPCRCCPRRGFILVTQPLPPLVRHKVYAAEYVANVASDERGLETSRSWRAPAPAPCSSAPAGSASGSSGRCRSESSGGSPRRPSGCSPSSPTCACSRTYPGFRPYCPDHLPVIGPDPRVARAAARLRPRGRRHRARAGHGAPRDAGDHGPARRRPARALPAAGCGGRRSAAVRRGAPSGDVYGAQGRRKTRSVAAALWAGGAFLAQDQRRRPAARPVLRIGACQDCLVTVDGVGGVRACVAPVHAGTSITTGGGAARG